jgi:hypothetical protein
MATKARVTDAVNATLARTIMIIFTMTGAPLAFGFGRAAVSGVVGAGAASATPAGLSPLEFFFFVPVSVRPAWL